ncbi:restriction endonuclease subunit S [Neorhizobium sp. IRS_2295]|uniref:restriction endonuclease subunit S n=1 Tax=Neorhizobium sp. IRS_2295 TaxID=3421959 RepID=UPI003D277FBA
MTRFETQPLEQVAVLFSGGTPRKSDAALWCGNVPWLTPRDMGNWTGTTEQSVSSTAVGNGTKLAPENACYVAVRGMSLHSEIRVVKSSKPLTFNQDIKAISALDAVDPMFLYYSLVAQKPQLLEWVTSAGHGTGVLETDRLKSLPIPIIPRSEQSRIAGIFASLDDKIELNRRMNETLESMAQAIFHDWFVDFGPTRRKLEGATYPVTIMGGLVQDAERAQALADLFPATLGDDGLPEGWSERKISDVAARVAMGPFGSRITKDNFVDHGVPVIRGKNLSAGFVDSDFVFLKPEKAEELKGSIARAQDIVFTHRGTLGQVGRIYPGATFEKYVVSQSQVLLSADPMKTSSLFLYYFFLSDAGQRAWMANAGGAGVPAIASPTRSLKAITFVDPGIEVAGEFAAIVEAFETRIVASKRETKTLEATRDLLLPKLMCGEIRLSAAEDLMEAAQ